MWCFVWSATILGDVFQRIRVLCVPDKSSSPDDFQNEVKIGFEELDDPESVDFWMSWVFLNPDLEGSAPPVWGQSCWIAKVIMSRCMSMIHSLFSCGSLMDR